MKYIRDGIYVYIPISDLEEQLLSQPEVLRLHRVRQNSSAYLTYTGNHATRYSHSLGAMHMAGLLFKALVRNSKKVYLDEIHTAAIKLLGAERLRIIEDHLLHEHTLLHGISEFYMSYGWSVVQEEPKFTNTINNILFQGLRIAALVHDIGHTPYSHAVEFALEDLAIIEDIKFKALKVIEEKIDLGDAGKIYKKGDLHEWIGIYLIKVLADSKRFLYSKDLSQGIFWEACWLSAIRIISVDQLGHFLEKEFVAKFSDKYTSLSEEEDSLAWYPLGSIINSPVDCDRLDYLRRDPQSYGMSEMVSFDYERIVNSVVLVHPRACPPLQDDLASKMLVLGFGRRALSALSDFHNDRMRQYRWLVNHHNVVRTDLALCRLVIRLYKILERNTNNSILIEVMKEENFEKLWDWSDTLEGLSVIDDAWLDSILRKIYSILKIKFKRLDELNLEEECLRYLDILYSRKLHLLPALWKRLDDFVPFADGFYSGFKEKTDESLNLFTELNTYKDPGEEYEEKRKVLSTVKFMIKKGCQGTDTIYFTNELIQLWKDKMKNEYRPFSFFHNIEEYLYKQFSISVVLVYKKITVYKKVPLVLNYDANNMLDDVCYLDEMSSFVDQLKNISSRDLRIYGYEVKPIDTIKDNIIKDTNNQAEENRQLGQLVGTKVFIDLQSKTHLETH